MADKNIQMKEKKGASWDALFPVSKAANIQIVDVADHFTATNVEDAMTELFAYSSSIDSTVQAKSSLGLVTLTDIVTNGSVVGDILIATMAVSCSAYDLLYLSSSGYNKAKADADETIPCTAMCVETGAGVRKVLKRGYVKNNSWSWTPGQLLYASTDTAGGVTATLPAASGNRVQIIGYAESATIMYFNPDYTFVQV